MRRALLVAAVAAAMLATGCGDDEEGGGATAPAPTGSEPVTIAVGVDPIFTPLFLAEAEDLFEQQGVQIEVRQFANAGAAADALVAGAADVAALPDYNLLSRTPRADLAAVGVFVEDIGNYVKVAAAADVSSPRDVERMGIVPGTFSEYAAALFVEEFGLGSSVEMVPSGPPEMPALLEKGDIDAFALWEPWPSRATEMGGKILMPVREFGASYVLVIATTDDWLQGHQQEADAIMAAMDTATKRTEQDPAAAAAATAEAANIPEELTRQAIDELDFGVRPISKEDRADFQRILDYLLERGIIDEAPPLDELIVADRG